MNSSSLSRQDSIPAGIGWMLMTMVWFVSLDATAKYLMQFYPVAQVIWARFFFHTVFVVIFIGVKIPYGLTSSRISLQLWRSLLMLATTVLFFSGIRSIPLATGSTIMFLTPIIVTVLAIPLLSEQVGLRRWCGVLVGFAGAVVVVRPGFEGFQTGLIFLLCAAFCHAFFQIATRQVRIYDNPSTSLFYTGLAGAVVTTMVVPFYWQWPDPWHWPLLLFLGVAGSIGHLCLIKAFSRAPVSVVSPFGYSSLLWATLYGIFIFGDYPDIWVFIGGALIIASGLYIFHREREVRRAQNDA